MRAQGPSVWRGNPNDGTQPETLIPEPGVHARCGVAHGKCHNHHACVYGVMLMVCAKTWCEQVNELDHEGNAEWLQANSVRVHVHEPLCETCAE